MAQRTDGTRGRPPTRGERRAPTDDGGDEARALLALWLVPELGPMRVRALRAAFGSARGAVVAARRGTWPPLPGLGAERTRSLARAVDPGRADLELARADRFGIRVVTDDHPAFPAAWATFDDLPPLLFVRGLLGDALARSPPGAVAIVGSRRASPGGRRFAFDAAALCASAGATVVSGLALGIDAAAHEGALHGRGHTVAVLAGGLDRPSPRSNDGLARAVLDAGGALVSEVPVGSSVDRGSFPRRNRLVAAAARGVLVVEAGAASGANLTASDAARYGRDVFVCPARPWDAAMAGNLALLRDGAVPITGLDDLPPALGLERPPGDADAGPQAGVPPGLEPFAWVLEPLAHDALVADEVVAASGRPVHVVLAALERLRAAGAVAVDGGGRYMRSGPRR